MRHPSTRANASRMVALLLCSGTLTAQGYFPHGAVGESEAFNLVSRVQVEISLVVEGNPSNALIRRDVSASGRLKFYNQQGQPVSVLVSGQGANGEPATEIPYYLDFFAGPTLQVWTLEGPPDELITFWTAVEGETGKVQGQLQFDFLDRRTQRLITSIPVPLVGDSNAHFISVIGSEGRQTGIAIANPKDFPVEVWAVLQNLDGSPFSRKLLQLGPRQQTAFFAESELQAPTGFSGVLAVLSAYDIAVVALRQADIQLSTAGDIDPDSIRVPFAFGAVENFLAVEELGSEDAAVSQGTVTLTRVGGAGTAGQNAEMSGPITTDGKFLVGPLDSGPWRVRATAESFCPLEQEVEFPSNQLLLRLTDLGLVNVQWLNATLRSATHVNLGIEGMVIKPNRQFNFHFDGSAYGPATARAIADRVAAVQRAFKMWVWYELPQLQLGVEDEGGQPAFFGGRDRYSEGQFPARSNTFRVIADPTLFETVQTFVEVDDENPGEVTRATLRFNPEACVGEECTLLPQNVSSILWEMLFLRSNLSDGQTLNVADFAISSLPAETERLAEQYTQISGSPRSMAGTPLDKNYWAVLRERPAGTMILPDREILPSQAVRRTVRPQNAGHKSEPY